MKTIIIGGRGYIGSALMESLGKDISCVDLVQGVDYDTLSKEYLEKFGIIILLAGRSSVKDCLSDPALAWEENVSKFQRLLGKLNDKQTFIYASSGSVYNNCKDITEENRGFYLTNIYDLTKFTIDQLAKLSDLNFYGLRFGTVCGYSPNMRWDLMLNKMYQDSNNGLLKISNPEISRPILAMSDLIRAVKVIMANPYSPGIYNLASFTETVGSLARNFTCDIATLPPSPAYNFLMDTTKFEKTFDFTFKGTPQSIIKSLDEKAN